MVKQALLINNLTYWQAQSEKQQARVLPHLEHDQRSAWSIVEHGFGFACREHIQQVRQTLREQGEGKEGVRIE